MKGPTITPRERVLRAIDHRTTDRAPADHGAHKAVTDRLIEKLGVADREELLQALEVDMRRVDFGRGQPMTGPDADGYMRDMWGARHPRSYRELTRERGGYILCGSQSFIEDIPLDNILTMYDENSKG